jgi:Uma2 family endonuclease
VASPYHLESVPTDGWTTDDLDALPDDGVRRELIDGVLHVSPAPTYHHQSITWRLAAMLDRSCPAEYDVCQGVEVRMTKRRALIPDVVVVASAVEARDPKSITPNEVLLAVEIISPSSVTTDRFTKPALYAHAGIPFYWTIGLADRGALLATYRLEPVGERYVETGSFTGEVKLDEPWPMAFVVDDIVPPSRRTGP